MRLVVYESADCYRTYDSVNRTKMVSQLERRYSPYLDVHHCFTVDKPRFELSTKSGDTVREFTTLQEDFTFLADIVSRNLPERNCGYLEAKRMQKPFHCPGLKLNDPDRRRHPVYQLLHTGAHLKPPTDEARREAAKQVCGLNFGEKTDLYAYCVAQEEKIEGFTDGAGRSRAVFIVAVVVLILYLLARPKY